MSEIQTIEQLRQKLFNPSEKDFDAIADFLLNHVVIAKRNIYYRMVDIEFYLYSQDHPDYITYPRTAKAGSWFFHMSGMDLCFESQPQHGGGILIRGIKRLDKEEKETEDKQDIFDGPIKSCDELFDQFNALYPDYVPQITLAHSSFETGFTTEPRYIRTKNDAAFAHAVCHRYGVADDPETVQHMRRQPYRYLAMDHQSASHTPYED